VPDLIPSTSASRSRTFVAAQVGILRPQVRVPQMADQYADVTIVVGPAAVEFEERRAQRVLGMLTGPLVSLLLGPRRMCVVNKWSGTEMATEMFMCVRWGVGCRGYGMEMANQLNRAWVH
jgi:hypothetical protein